VGGIDSEVCAGRCMKTLEKRFQVVGHAILS
jgi:hypothetical protein